MESEFSDVGLLQTRWFVRVMTKTSRTMMILRTTGCNLVPAGVCGVLGDATPARNLLSRGPSHDDEGGVRNRETGTTGRQQQQKEQEEDEGLVGGRSTQGESARVATAARGERWRRKGERGESEEEIGMGGGGRSVAWDISVRLGWLSRDEAPWRRSRSLTYHSHGCDRQPQYHAHDQSPPSLPPSPVLVSPSEEPALTVARCLLLLAKLLACLPACGPSRP